MRIADIRLFVFIAHTLPLMHWLNGLATELVYGLVIGGQTDSQVIL